MVSHSRAVVVVVVVGTDWERWEVGIGFAQAVATGCTDHWGPVGPYRGHGTDPFRLVG